MNRGRAYRTLVSLGLVWLLALPKPSLGDPSELGPAEIRGQQLFEEGTSPQGAEVRASFSNGLELPGSAARCGGCHGSDGTGRPEAGIRPANIRWSPLTRSYGHRHADGRHHPPFEVESLKRYLLTGILPGGAPGDRAMPRYEMSPGDLDDLIAYLKRLGNLRDPGVSEQALALMLLVPDRGPQLESGAAVFDVLQTHFERFNANGGFYGRKLELRVRKVADSELTDVERLARSIRQQEPFALVNPVLPSPVAAARHADLYGELSRAGIPVLLPLTATPWIENVSSKKVFHLYPPLEVQLAALLREHLARQKPATEDPGGAERPGARVGLLGLGVSETVPVDHTLAEVLASASLEVSFTATCAQLAADPVATLSAVRTARASIVVSRCDGMAVRRGLEAASSNDFQPSVFTASTQAAPLLDSDLQGFHGPIYVAYPSWASDRRRSELALLARRTVNSSSVKTHPQAALAAEITSLVLAEALKRCGREITRDRFIAALESLYAFDTGLTRPITFGPNRRTGVRGVYAFNPRSFVPSRGAPAPPWIELP